MKKTHPEAFWWHRLAMVVFWVITAGILALSFVFYYTLESFHAEHYTIHTTLQDTIDKARKRREEATGGGRLLIKESFLGAFDLTSSLGCKKQDGTVRVLSKELFEGRTHCVSEKEPGKQFCSIDAQLCGGDPQNIVKYSMQTRYGVDNYLRILVKTFLTLAVWVVVARLVYRKLILYLFLGKQ